MSKGGGWGGVALAVAALLIWNDGCAGKSAVVATGTVAAAGAGVGAGAAVGSATGAGALATGRALLGPQQGQHAAKRGNRGGDSQRPATVLCPKPDGTMGLCSSAVPGASSADRPAAGATPPCDITAEPRERVLPDNDGDGEPERITLPELGCN